MMKRRCEKVIVVEGKYDRVRLLSLLEATVLTTEGFGIFKNSEKRALLAALAREKGLVVLADPDGAGKVIRAHLQTITGGKGVTHLYVPPTPGKEKRKSAPSKEGLLGVEGIDNETLLALFENAHLLTPEGEAPPPPRKPVTKQDLYRLGFSGTKDAAARREAYAVAHGLPKNLSANALLDAINLFGLPL